MAGMCGVLFGAPLRMAPSALFCPTLHWVACQARQTKTKQDETSEARQTNRLLAVRCD